MSNIADDALFIDSDTTIEEVQQFLRSRAENPIHIDGTTVWNFSSYKVDEAALEDAVRNKLRHDEFIIPYQVGGTWAVMYHLLPRRLKEGEILVYHRDSQTYKAFENFVRQIPQEAEDEFRYQVGQIVSNEVIDNDA